MKGISSSAKTQIYELIDDMFDKMALNLVGEVPSLRGKKSILFTSKPDMTLAHLFLQSLGSTNPMPIEIEAMKNILSTAEEYVSSLRAKTKAEVAEKLDAYVKETRAKNKNPSTVDLKAIVNEKLISAQDHFKVIVEAESTKSRNMGKALQISKVGASQGVQDPNVFFVVLRDAVTCKHCIAAHLMPDKSTPRIYKLSDVKFGYLSKDEKGKSVSVSGQHPLCRCFLSFLAPGFGFKNGAVTFISQEHDEHKQQKG